jgi:hypothetical protein
MRFHERYDKVLIGILSGLLLPFMTGLVIYLFSSGHESIATYLKKIYDSDIVTHAISLCVFPNLVIFLLFNRFDMLRATRGVLTITIIWAFLVFAIKIFG